MEIHRPKNPIHSWREFGVELITITVGVLIALSFEGITEWQHHRSLVADARANLTAEIRDNKKELDSFLAKVPEMGTEREHALSVADTLISKHRGKTPPPSLSIAYHPAQLRMASWNTAQATGAFGYMRYADVQRFAAVYDLQQRFTHLQQQSLDATIAAIPAIDWSDAALPEVRDWRVKVAASLSYLYAEQQIGTALKSAYDDLLK